jgi:plasmid rolling circle replication initiator protein Rep
MPTADSNAEGDKFYLSDVSPKDKPWDLHRELADLVTALYDCEEFESYRRRGSECSQWLKFALTVKDEGELALKLQDAYFCRLRHCPVCQWRRSSMWRARFFEAVPRIQEDYPKTRFIFLTLTVRNCPLKELRATLTHMNKSWVRLSQRKGFPALGWVKSVEVTRNATTGEAHPHLHCLLMDPDGYFKRGYLSQAKWTQLWRESLRAEYDPIVNVKVIKPKLVNGNDNGLYIAICETLKYSVKPSDLVADRDWLHELTRQLHKTRAIAVGGVLKAYISAEEPEDLIDGDIEEKEDLSELPKISFGWREMIKRYTKK